MRCRSSSCAISARPPLREPQDLRYHCLLQYDDPEGRHPWLHWKTWLEVERNRNPVRNLSL